MNNTTTIYNSDLDIVIWTISGFVNLNDFKEAANNTHQLRKKHNASKQINDINNMKVLSNEIQEFIDKSYFPDAKNSGLKYFAFVVPENTFGKLSMENVNKGASEKYNMDIKYFNSQEKAIEWLNAK